MNEETVGRTVTDVTRTVGTSGEELTTFNLSSENILVHGGETRWGDVLT
jgi:hypothetical protein